MLINYALLFFLLFVPCIAAYGEEPSWHTGAAAPTADVREKSETVKITRIHEIAALQQTVVTLEGVFRGWKGKCSSSYMLTKSDWILEDDTDCIYITGRMPANVSPLKPQGERFLVTGRVVKNKKGKAILKAEQLTRLLKK
jgi:hypothetical protein